MAEQRVEFAQAVALLEKKYRGLEQAAQTLYEKLATGAIRSIAGEITRFEDCDALGGAGKPAAHRESWLIPSCFWGRASLSPIFGGDWRQSSFRALRSHIDWGRTSVAGRKTIDPRVITTSYRMRFVAVDAAQINALLGVGAERQAVSYANAQQKAADWLKARFGDPVTTGMSKSDFATQARAEISGLSGRGFEAAWQSAVVEFPDRAKAGRRRRHSGNAIHLG